MDTNTNTGSTVASQNPTHTRVFVPISVPNQQDTNNATATSEAQGIPSALSSSSVRSGSSDVSGSGAPGSPTSQPTASSATTAPQSPPSAASGLPPSTTALTPSSSLPDPTGGPSRGVSPIPPGPHGPNIGAIIGTVLAALVMLLCIVLALIFLLRRRARTRAKRRSRGSPWQRLEPHVCDDASSIPESSVWTWFGSAPIDSDYEPKQESRPQTPDSQAT
ncbi:hypothetical protein GSI_08552 [Ganoderma sinense ZZ0214-1]|uniref:Uncharacterized protein n=1 Tax=Ganoderma sinense ZZ0214-1 TaxID=1077348 RepID=A0A2G8S452_9APHY|nr:hypothetical protein GSI_08552 [Ganoderma sinense ZZ0214-1]